MATHSILQKITARAKTIHRAHPSKKWTDCIKQASREIKSGGGASKSVKKVKKSKSKTMHKIHTTKKHRSTKGIASAISRVKDHYKNQLANELLRRDLAKTKREKKKIGKKIIETRKKLKKVM